MVDQLSHIDACRLCGAPLVDPQLNLNNLCANCAAPELAILGQTPQAASGSAAEAAAPYSPQRVTPEAEPAQPTSDPDNPRWGPALGIAAWLFSVAAIIIIPLIAVVVWYLIERKMGRPVPDLRDQEGMVAWALSPNAVLTQVIFTGVGHLFTLAFCWLTVTRARRFHFWESFGMKWSINPTLARAVFAAGIVIAISGADNWGQRLLFTALLGLLASNNPKVHKTIFVLGTATIMVGVQVALSKLIPQTEKTPFEEILKTSANVRIAVALMAVLTAPLIEEMIYRGMLYSGLRKKLGIAPAIVIVTLLFAGVHVPQYNGAWGALTALTILSLALTVIRARTRSLLPPIWIHLVFNSFGAIGILMQNY
ncbi:MAG TPA: type II CAAX endopeptidase family protein [Blastocatellia bacterium]|nr:type II CAAX endopeptidase family protein [Blastocatellia bacterium]